MPVSAAERSAIGRIGARTKLANCDPAEATAAARRVANWQRFIDQTDPELPMPERERRAVELRRAHMARAALASARSRRLTAEARQQQRAAAELLAESIG